VTNPNQPNWHELLLQILCQIYMAWGGDCADLGVTPWESISTLTQTYRERGAPHFETAADRAAFLARLDELEDLLASPHNDLDPGDDQRLRDLLGNLREDLGQES
jgi:hypothetical protein